MSKKKVLIADDEPNIRLLVSRLLGEDFSVLQASDGQEAINIARNEKPDIILLDIMMPNVDGYTACSVIKTDPTTEAIPVVMLTAIGLELNKKLSEKLGASGYITKPFTLPDLLSVITQLLPT